MKKEYPQNGEKPERQDWWPTEEEESEPASRKEEWPTQPDEESGVYSSTVRRKDYIGPEPVREEPPQPVMQETEKKEEPFTEKRTRTNFDPRDYNYQDGQRVREPEPYHAQTMGQPNRNPFLSAALVLGILSILFMVTGIGGLFFGGLGIITAVLSRGRGPVKGKAKAGMFISLFGFLLSLMITISAFHMIFRMTPDEMKEMFRQYGYVLELPGEESGSPFPPGIMENFDEEEPDTEKEKAPSEAEGSRESDPFGGQASLFDPSHAVEL